MIFLVGIFSFAHILFYLSLAWKWRNIVCKEKEGDHALSIIIPTRNEDENIECILIDLERQSYPKDKFEVIVVDDFSEDKTCQQARKIAETLALDFKILQLENLDEKGKKHALTRGVNEAKYELVLTTDADCRIGEKWIESYAHAFTEETHIVAGPVSLYGHGLFAQMQKIEFVGLMVFGAATLTSNNPSMCSGANLGFRKTAFCAVGGYKDNIHLPSGDDEFLLYDIMKKYPSSGSFLKAKDAVIQTKAHQSFHSFFNQRSRWISKWKYNKNWKLRLLALLFFSDYLVFVFAFIMTLFGKIPVDFIATAFVVRGASNYILLRSTSNFFHAGRVGSALFLLQIFYPFHVLFMGVLSIFGWYTWKGRKF